MEVLISQMHHQKMRNICLLVVLLIYLGDTSKNKQLINNSPYWSNLYGKDGTDEELKEIVYGLNKEDLEILQNGLSFLNGLEKDDMKKLNSCYNI